MTTGNSNIPATPKRNATMSHASTFVVTARRVSTLQPAQIDTAAIPNEAPFRYWTSLKPHRPAVHPAPGNDAGECHSGTDQRLHTQRTGDTEPCGERTKSGAANRAAAQKADRIDRHHPAAHLVRGAHLQRADHCDAEQ